MSIELSIKYSGSLKLSAGVGEIKPEGFMRVERTWATPSNLAKAKAAQKAVRILRPEDWIGKKGFACHQFATAHVLYEFMPELLRPVAQGMRRLKAETEAMDSLYYAAFLDFIFLSMIGFERGLGKTYADLARETGWELPQDNNLTEAQLVSLGESLDGKIKRGGFLVASKSYHCEAWVLDPYFAATVELRSKSDRVPLWPVGHFKEWLAEVRRPSYGRNYLLAIWDMRNFSASNRFFPTRLAGREEIKAVLQRRPLKQIMQEVERIYPRYREMGCRPAGPVL